MQLNLSIKAALGFHHHFRQNAGVIVPLPETFQISVSPFVVDDEGHHIVPQALLEQDQPTDSAVAVLKGKNPLKAHMEAQNVPALHLRQRFIFPNQRFQLGADLICRQHERHSAGGFGASVLPRCDPFPAVIHRAKDELVMELLNEFRSQRLLCMVEDVVNADTVIQDLHQIGHLHGLKGHRHLAFPEDGLHLLPGQPVAGHAAGAVGQIDLDIIVQPVKALLLFLPEQLLRQCREYHRLFYTRFYFHRPLGIFWNQPCAVPLNHSGDTLLRAIATDE